MPDWKIISRRFNERVATGAGGFMDANVPPRTLTVKRNLTVSFLIEKQQA